MAEMNFSAGVFALAGVIILVLLVYSFMSEDRTDRIHGWEDRKHEDKGIHEAQEDSTRTPRQYPRQ